MAKNCPQCGRPNNDLASRCLYCGRLFPGAGSHPPAEKESSPEEKSRPEKRPGRKKLDSFQVVVSPRQTLSEDKVAELAEILHTDRYSIRHKLLYPAPWIAQAFPQPEPAQALLARLSALGLDAYVVKQSGVETIKMSVSAVRLEALKEKEIVLRTAEEGEMVLPYSELVLIVRGRIWERPEREEDMSEERPGLNLGRMLYGPEEEREKKTPVRQVMERISVRARPGRLRWVLRPGMGSEVMDLYHQKAHQPVRLVETELDYRGLGEKMQPSSLLNFNTILRTIQERCPRCPVDNTFNLVGYTFTETPAPDKVRRELAAVVGATDSSKKIFDTRAAFTEHSARIYLHFLHLRFRSPSASASSPDR